MHGQVFAPLAGAFLILAACSGGGSSSGSSGNGAPEVPEVPARDPGRVLASFAEADPNNPGDGVRTAPSVARLYSEPGGQIRLDMVEGPMEGMVIFCDDRSGAQCHVNAAGVGATGTGSLSARRKGDFAYVGQFVVNHDMSGVSYTNTHSVHAHAPDRAHLDVHLPDGALRYNGQFAAGAGVGSAEGMVSGTATLFANFDTATVSGEMEGAFDEVEGPGVQVVFTGLRIDRDTAYFATDSASRISFQGERAWGYIDGAFYGPEAQEAAGAFSFGNDAGGMSGVFLACRRGLDCIQPE